MLQQISGHGENGMKKYKLHITKAAERDLNEALDYIEFTLLNPQASDHLLDLFEKTAGKLADAPQAHQLIDDSVLMSWGIRFVTVQNYLLFYIISEADDTVYILRFLYTRRDWMTILHAGCAQE